jgi:nucleoside 2-deoxyribosyltransferase
VPAGSPDVNWQLRWTYTRISPGATLTIEPTLKNNGINVLEVTRVSIKMEWMQSPISTDCSIRINPEQKRRLPIMTLKVPFYIEIKDHEVIWTVKTKVLTEKGWVIVEDNSLPSTMPAKPAEDANYRVFLSHSNSENDKAIMKNLVSALRSSGITVFVAEEINQAGEDLWAKIRAGIDQCNCVLVFWTADGANSGDIREEIGYAIGRGKKIIPYAEQDLRGSVRGKEYIRLDRTKINDSLQAICERILELVDDEAIQESETSQQEDKDKST